MPEPRVTVVVPTLHAGAPLSECVAALARQTFPSFDVVVVDNSGRGLVKETAPQWQGCGLRIDVVYHDSNLGFGAAINRGAARSRSPYVATLNDDAVPTPGWLGALVAALEAHPEAGSCASKILLAGRERFDSAGMLLSGDASSKQRGHGRPAGEFTGPEEVLMPSACAALYRREMLDEIGWFDEVFFLYVEDSDVGLRARWAGWTCRYAPEAEVEHRYSQSAGRASPLKAYYVERNRLFLLAKTFPLSMALGAPWVALARYGWHVLDLVRGSGRAGEFRQAGHSPAELAWIVARAHISLVWHLPHLLSGRRRVFRTARLTAVDFRSLAERFSIGPREVAGQ